MDEIYEAGYSARDAGLGRGNNPYDNGTDEYKEWDEGWWDCNERLFNEWDS